MRFVITTLIDITETKEYHKHGLEQQQQANYTTLMQTLGLRANPYPVAQFQEAVPVSGMFGSRFKGKHTVWIQTLDFDQQDSHTIEFMQQDLNLVPIIGGLTETIKLNTNVFNTSCSKEKNIIFSIIEQD